MQIEIHLLSETIFGSGETGINSIDIEILQNKLGIPYMKGKTFKGKLRQEVESIVKLLEDMTSKSYKKYVDNMFGREGMYNDNTLNMLETLKFSNVEISKDILCVLEKGIKEKIFTKEEILGAFTDIRSFTSIEKDDIAKTKSLRQSRVVKSGIKYYVDLTVLRELTIIEKGLLACGVASLKNIGAMESRGKGKVKCVLLVDGEDVTKEYINKLEKEVV